MKYKMYNINKLRKDVDSNKIYNQCRKNNKDFTRNRKLTPKDLIYYTINNRGKTTKMELYDFIEQFNLNKVSDAALLKQREKLDENVFKKLNQNSLTDFYNLFQDEVKNFKGYIVTAIDGSDCEIPNTPTTRKRYQTITGKDAGNVARIKLSNCYDLLNNYILDTEIEEYKHSENELAERHMKIVETFITKYPIISIRDRGYFSLSYMYHNIKNNKKFVIRLNKNFLKQEQSSMKTDDEIVEIKYQYDRIRNYIYSDTELYNYYENGNTMKVRFVNIKLSTGEIETIITNLDQKDFTKEDINYLYQLRWGIETSYAYLKESMMVTNISSSKDCIIKQEIYSQMMVYNIMQSIVNDLESEIDQDKYKHKMKININMATGFVKRYLVRILVEKNKKVRKKLSDQLFDNILDNIVPVRSGRHNERKSSTKNKHPINKRKSF